MSSIYKMQSTPNGDITSLRHDNNQLVRLGDHVISSLVSLLIGWPSWDNDRWYYIGDYGIFMVS